MPSFEEVKRKILNDDLDVIEENIGEDFPYEVDEIFENSNYSNIEDYTQYKIRKNIIANIKDLIKEDLENEVDFNLYLQEEIPAIATFIALSDIYDENEALEIMYLQHFDLAKKIKEKRSFKILYNNFKYFKKHFKKFLNETYANKDIKIKDISSDVMSFSFLKCPHYDYLTSHEYSFLVRFSCMIEVAINATKTHKHTVFVERTKESSDVSLFKVVRRLNTTGVKFTGWRNNFSKNRF